MTEPYVFQISCVVLTLVWLMHFRHGGARYTWQLFFWSIILGWFSSLVVEGLGLYGMFAGPEPHM